MNSRVWNSQGAAIFRILIVAAVLAVTLAAPRSASAAVTCFVKWNAAGLNNGGSWTNAFTNLQSALGSLCSDVWVAAGVYKPDAASPGDQTLSFTVMAISGGKRVYGGFAGTETLLSQRDPDANLTILSGDIDSNDTNLDGNHIDESHTQIAGNNSYHVVTFNSATGNVLSTTILDGFVITGGAADGVGGYNGAGGGIICYGINAGNICSPNLYSLTIIGNYALNGGGIYNLGYLSGTSSPTLVAVLFQGNGARDNGGAMLNSGLSSPHLTGVTFDTNTAQGGGAVFNQGSGTGQDASPVFVDAYFTNNTATDPTASWGSGGAVYNSGYDHGSSSPSFTQATFDNNSAITGGGAVYNDGEISGISSPSFTDVVFNSNHGGNYGGAVENNGGGGASNPSFLRVTFSSNDAGYGAAVYTYADNSGSGSPIFTNVTFQGNTATYDGGALLNSGGTGGVSSPVFRNVTFNGNHAGGSGGAMVNVASGGTSAPLFWNVILWGDTAGYMPEIYNNLGAATISNSVVQGGCPSITGATCGTGNLSTDPMLGALGLHGGGTWTMALLAGSSAIDTGDDTVCAAAPVSGADQRGVARPQGSHCDIGAYEVDYATHVFADMPVAGKEWMEPWVNAFYYAGITTGCGASPLVYCPENPVTRASMAVFILRARHGADYVPPATTHTFSDMPVAGKEWMEPWVDQLYAEGITTGCGASPLTYCPEAPVTRGAMAVFLLRAVHGSGYIPPAASGVFSDVPVVGKEWMEPWIIQFYNEGITTGCGVSPLRYCPENSVTRASMAVFIDRAYSLYP